ncbi:MAG: hypothetical protein LZF62_360158 [Nitrospira sp.]|nr:MAG: hypothetical protein LZF62_360158 [Nitrospira sp.]
MLMVPLTRLVQGKTGQLPARASCGAEAQGVGLFFARKNSARSSPAEGVHGVRALLRVFIHWR